MKVIVVYHLPRFYDTGGRFSLSSDPSPGIRVPDRDGVTVFAPGKRISLHRSDAKITVLDVLDSGLGRVLFDDLTLGNLTAPSKKG